MASRSGPLTPRRAVALTHLNGRRSREYLPLNQVDVSDDGLDPFTDLEPLEGLCLNDAAVTAAGVESLQKSLSRAKIDHRERGPTARYELWIALPAADRRSTAVGFASRRGDIGGIVTSEKR